MPELKPQRARVVDVGAKTRELQKHFGILASTRAELDASGELDAKAPNRATPQHLKKLLQSLRTMTDQLDARVRDELSPLSSIALDQIAGSLIRWNERLNGYIAAVDAAAPDDRRAVLWTVTAPLLLGFYGGEESTESRRTLDAVTPFIIADILKVESNWQDERWRLLIQDLKDNAADVAGSVAQTVALVVIAVGTIGTLLVLLTRGRR